MKIFEEVVYTAIVLILSLSIFFFFNYTFNNILIKLYKQKNSIENYVELKFMIDYLYQCDLKYCKIEKLIPNPFRFYIFTNSSCIILNSFQISYHNCYENLTITNNAFKSQLYIKAVFIKNQSNYYIIFG